MRYNNKYLHEVIDKSLLRGKRCFIIGGGPSLVNFPVELLKDEYVIGVNAAFHRFNPQINYSNDMHFNDMMNNPPYYEEELIRLSHLWKQYKGLKIFREQIDRKHYKNGECLVKPFPEPCLSLDIQQGIFCGNNSGFGAMMLAVALKANPIYLLGFDLKTHVAEEKGEDRTHWHKGYPGQTPRLLVRRMGQFHKPFCELAPILAENGIQVINLGPDSALGCFIEQNYKEVLVK